MSNTNKQGQIEALEDQLKNRKPFSYDPEADALYQQYRQQYETVGRQAMEDTVGQAAALTGGYGSTYAESAGANAYNRYLGEFAALVPELYDRSAAAYKQETENLFNRLSIETKQQNDAFDRCMKLLGSGVRPSDADLAAAGMSAQQAATALAIYQYNTGAPISSGTTNSGTTNSGNTADNGGTSSNGNTSDSGSTGVGTTTFPNGGYDNGNLSFEQVKGMQEWLGVAADGQYGAKTQKAAEERFGIAGLSAVQAWIAYQKAIGAYGSGGGGGQTGNDRVE